MRNYIQRGDTITVPSPAAVTGGSPVLIGQLFGVAAGDAEQGEDLDLGVVGVFELPKVGANEFAIGDAVYFDSGTKLLTSTSEANVRIGVAVKTVDNSSATATVRLAG